MAEPYRPGSLHEFGFNHMSPFLTINVFNICLNRFKIDFISSLIFDPAHNIKLSPSSNLSNSYILTSGRRSDNWKIRWLKIKYYKRQVMLRNFIKKMMMIQWNCYRQRMMNMGWTLFDHCNALTRTIVHLVYSAYIARDKMQKNEEEKCSQLVPSVKLAHIQLVPKKCFYP